jgi:hypothetical protein
MDKPFIMVDFRSARLKESLPKAAAEALDAANKPSSDMRQQIANHIKKVGVDDASLYKILRIVTRHVDVRPRDFREMVAALGGGDRGLEAALRFIPGVQPPTIVWGMVRELAEVNPILAAQFEGQILNRIQMGETNVFVYYVIMARFNEYIQEVDDAA